MNFEKRNYSNEQSGAMSALQASTIREIRKWFKKNV